ncbi:MAG: hemerythrin domain-containing protein [Gammaproteobacteria bacterium]|nr:hemerythrin domain-containing protein [Gammaproteobacteria bacterium]
MYRHPSLRSLSSDHHSGLVLARKARNAANGDLSDRTDAWKAIQIVFRNELEPHFQLEEQGLLPALRAVGEVDLVERTLQEHRQMRLLIAGNGPDSLLSFAELLSAHIRFEEQELFNTAQRQLEPDVLTGLKQMPDSLKPTGE